jgi:indolepyruvate ferredoxin oxidoreductase alpha subunit
MAEFKMQGGKAVKEPALLGDEAAALGALHAGISAVYGYPGTPSTEIMEYLQGEALLRGEASEDGISPEGAAFTAKWCANEKTALEAALGVSFAGRRALVTMKHVGLNVASDPFINGALVEIKGGLVVAVADDPGMHSSQGEQDSRYYAAFALTPCLEPRSQQEAYDMMRDAFDVSEDFHVPVLFRLVTRLSHARAAIVTAPERGQNACEKTAAAEKWMLLPAFARKNYKDLIAKQEGVRAWSAAHRVNKLETEGKDQSFAVITSGLGGNYYEENLADLAAARGKAPARLHIGAYPLPGESIIRLCAGAKSVLVLEEGQPFIEEKLRGILPQTIAILGRRNGEAVPRTGELDPDRVRAALDLAPRPGILNTLGPLPALPAPLPGRPPQLCQGCPHADSYETINRVVADLDGAPGHPSVSVNSDIGCYSLGASPPYRAIESIVCMGASIGMARGAADAGIPHALAVIGDSTFYHSGITGLLDAVQGNTPMTVIILDNSIVAMTGCQNAIFPSDKLKGLILGCGVDPDHVIELEAKKQHIVENAEKLKREVQYRGLSVIVFRRECLEAVRKRLKRPGEPGQEKEGKL